MSYAALKRITEEGLYVCYVKPCSKISILQSMKILADSWEVVTKETIINCFRKSGITPAVQQAAIADSEDPFKDLQDSLHDLRKAD